MVVGYAFTFEIFPTPVRSQGMCICIIFERGGICIVPYITNVLQKTSFALTFLVVGGVALLASLLGLVLPETKGSPTRESFDDLSRGRKSGTEERIPETYRNDCFEE